MASPTLSDMQNSVLALLHETQDSPVAELDASAGGSTAITTADQITKFLNEGCADLARNAFPVPGAASLSSQSAQMYAYSQIATTDTGTLWYARSVTFNNFALIPISRAAIERWFPTWQTDAAGSPLYWFRNGVEGFGIYPAPGSAATLAAAGFEIPQPLANGTDTLSAWLPDHLTKLPVWYAAAQVALQNDEDMSLRQRAVIWSEAYQEGVLELQKQLWQSDPTLARALWGAPPAPPQAMMQTQGSDQQA
ncbi:MAG TPA: hypothetical protein VFW40_02710 [Capsulimonadaceae bacterium]|nr:hypothetical protein [Capsulimonadaceae bacterium]